MRRSLRQRFLIARYILRAHLGPFAFSLVTLMFVFLLQFIMKFIDQLVGKGLTPWVIMELIALSLAWMLVLAVPMSVLVATLMAFGDLSSRNEITAMKACGVSTYRMMLPVFAGALAVGLALLWFNNDVLPDANHALRTLTVDITRKKPMINLRDGVFSQEIPGYSILVRKTFEKSNDLEGVTLFDYTNPGVNVCITAERGTISFSPDYRKLILNLTRGEIHELDLQRMMAYRKIRFESHRIAMDVEGFDFARSSESALQRGNRELSAPAMMAIVDSLRHARNAVVEGLRERTARGADTLLAGQPVSMPAAYAYAPGTAGPYAALNDARAFSTTIATELFRVENFDHQIDQYMVEIHKKYSIPMACVVFVLIGVPLGIMSRRGGFGTAATLSLGFFVLYYACLIGGEKLADRGFLSPFTGMWSANIILSLMGVYLTVRVARETVFIDMSFMTRLIPRRWRSRFRPADGDPGRP